MPWNWRRQPLIGLPDLSTSSWIVGGSDDVQKRYQRCSGCFHVQTLKWEQGHICIWVKAKGTATWYILQAELLTPFRNIWVSQIPNCGYPTPTSVRFSHIWVATSGDRLGNVGNKNLLQRRFHLSIDFSNINFYHVQTSRDVVFMFQVASGTLLW